MRLHGIPEDLFFYFGGYLVSLGYDPAAEPSRRYRRAYPAFMPEQVVSFDDPGFLVQGSGYPFDGNEVSHGKLQGDLWPAEMRRELSGLMSFEYSSTMLCFPINQPGVYYHADNGGEYGYCTVIHCIESVPGESMVVSLAQWEDVISHTADRTERAYLYQFRYRPRENIVWYATERFSFVVPKGPRGIKRFENFVTYSLNRVLERYSGNFRNRRRYSFSSVADADVVETWAQHKVKLLSRRMFASGIRDIVFGSVEPDLVHSVVDGQRAYDGNALNWASKLTSLGGEISSTLSLVDSLGNPKSWASTWLSWRFGTRLEYNTSIDILDAIWNRLLTIRTDKYAGYNVSRAKSIATFMGRPAECRMRLVCANESHTALMTAVKKFMDWGAWPSLNNSFDLIPLSFVVDWLGDLSTILDNIDDLVYKQYLKVILCERTLKLVVPVDEQQQTHGITMSSGLDLSLFFRWHSTTLPDFGVLAGWDPLTPSPINAVDGVTLLLQLLT